MWLLLAQSRVAENPMVLLVTPPLLVSLFVLLRLPRLLRRSSNALPLPPGSPAPLSLRDDFVVWVAQGFGSGLAPIAPGTFGSLLGLVWFALLTTSGTVLSFVIGLLAGLALSIAFCGKAEKILRQKDPGSVVLDEITAVPICFLPWVAIEHSRFDQMPSAAFFFGPSTWILSLILFGLFRLFDVWKPWPIRNSQKLRGGWGATLDDVLAAIVVAVLAGIALAF